MIILLHSDASYLSVTKARSRAGGYHYMSDDSEYPPDNVPIQNVCKIMTNVMEYVAGAEIGEIFISAKESVPEHTTMIEMAPYNPQQ